MTTTQKQILTQQVAGKYQSLQKFNALNERSRRLWAATEAEAVGRGGLSVVVAATGLDYKTAQAGIAELNYPETAAAPGRIRRLGGGRRKVTETDRTLTADLKKLIDPQTRGDPESSLRWTSKSTGNLAQALQDHHHTISAQTIRRMLKTDGYSL